MKIKAAFFSFFFLFTFSHSYADFADLIAIDRQAERDLGFLDGLNLFIGIAASPTCSFSFVDKKLEYTRFVAIAYCQLDASKKIQNALEQQLGKTLEKDPPPLSFELKSDLERVLIASRKGFELFSPNTSLFPRPDLEECKATQQKIEATLSEPVTEIKRLLIVYKEKAATRREGLFGAIEEELKSGRFDADLASRLHALTEEKTRITELIARLTQESRRAELDKATKTSQLERLTIDLSTYRVQVATIERDLTDLLRQNEAAISNQERLQRETEGLQKTLIAAKAKMQAELGAQIAQAREAQSAEIKKIQEEMSQYQAQYAERMQKARAEYSRDLVSFPNLKSTDPMQLKFRAALLKVIKDEFDEYTRKSTRSQESRLKSPAVTRPESAAHLYQPTPKHHIEISLKSFRNHTGLLASAWSEVVFYISAQAIYLFHSVDPIEIGPITLQIHENGTFKVNDEFVRALTALIQRTLPQAKANAIAYVQSEEGQKRLHELQQDGPLRKFSHLPSHTEERQAPDLTPAASAPASENPSPPPETFLPPFSGAGEEAERSSLYPRHF